MKKFILLSMLAALGVATYGQTPNTYNKSDNILEWGTALDTIAANGVDSVEFNIKGYGVCSLVLKTDSTSGTPAYTAILYKAVEGYAYVPVDTITHTGSASNEAYFATFNVTHNRYMVIITATAAAQESDLTLAGIFRKQY